MWLQLPHHVSTVVAGRPTFPIITSGNSLGHALCCSISYLQSVQLLHILLQLAENVLLQSPHSQLQICSRCGGILLLLY